MQELIEENFEFFRDEFPNIKYIKLIKSGKEAEVHLVESEGTLLSLKVYKQNLKYSSRHDYLKLHELGNGTKMRAVRKKKKAGIRILGEVWVNREYKVLKDLYEEGANVPKPVLLGKNAYLMEYLGDINEPAPKLVDCKLTRIQAEIAFESVVECIWILLDLGYVHGDLSAYNILWFKEQTYVIDFPQVLNIFHNIDCVQKLIHDINQVNEYFGKYDLKIADEEQEEMISGLIF